MTPLGKIHGVIERCEDAEKLDEITGRLKVRLAEYRSRQRELELKLREFGPFDLRVGARRRLQNDYVSFSSKARMAISAIASSTNKAASIRLDERRVLCPGCKDDD